MRNPYAPRRRSLASVLALGAGGLLIALVTALVGLRYAGVDLSAVPGLAAIPFFQKAGPDYSGMVEVPMSGSDIPAYTKVTRDHLFDKKKGDFAVMYRKPEAVPKGAILEPTKIAGRVLSHDKAAGYVFTEDDFFPKGTKPGIAGAVPPGKRSFVFEAEKVQGMAGLKQGDHFDIVGALSIDDKKGGNGNPLVASSSAAAPPPKRAAVRPLVQNGVMLTAVTVRQVPTSSTGLTTGTQYKTRPVQEVTVAVDAAEVAALSEA